MRTLVILWLAIIPHIATAGTTWTSASISWGNLINGEEYSTCIDATFTNVPQYDIDAGGEPPLSVSKAYRLASKEFNKLREPQIQYDMQSVDLTKYGSNGYWCYVFSFSAVSDWVNVEPYKSKLLLDPSAKHYSPRIVILVLMDGHVVMPQPRSH